MRDRYEREPRPRGWFRSLALAFVVVILIDVGIILMREARSPTPVSVFEYAQVFAVLLLLPFGLVTLMMIGMTKLPRLWAFAVVAGGAGLWEALFFNAAANSLGDWIMYLWLTGQALLLVVFYAAVTSVCFRDRSRGSPGSDSAEDRRRS